MGVRGGQMGQGGMERVVREGGGRVEGVKSGGGSEMGVWGGIVERDRWSTVQSKTNKS